MCHEKHVLNVSVWICAFSINQHASICGGFGPEPADVEAFKAYDAGFGAGT